MIALSKLIIGSPKRQKNMETSSLGWLLIFVLWTNNFMIQSHACKKSTEKIDCKDFWEREKGICEDEHVIKKGERQSLDMTVGLYKGVSSDVTVNQVNFLLFPREISRVISALIVATGTVADLLNH